MRWLILLGHSPLQTWLPHLNQMGFSERMSAGPWGMEQGGHKALCCLCPGLSCVDQHLRGLGAWQLVDSGCFLLHHRMHRLVLRCPWGCE